MANTKPIVVLERSGVIDGEAQSAHRQMATMMQSLSKAGRQALHLPKIRCFYVEFMAYIPALTPNAANLFQPQNHFRESLLNCRYNGRAVV